MTSVLLLFECLRSVSGLCVLVLVLGVKVNLVWPFEGEVPNISVDTCIHSHIYVFPSHILFIFCTVCVK